MPPFTLDVIHRSTNLVRLGRVLGIHKQLSQGVTRFRVQSNTVPYPLKMRPRPSDSLSVWRNHRPLGLGLVSGCLVVGTMWCCCAATCISLVCRGEMSIKFTKHPASQWGCLLCAGYIYLDFLLFFSLINRKRLGIYHWYLFPVVVLLISILITSLHHGKSKMDTKDGFNSWMLCAS
jgi:hypothetical protein